MARLFIAIDLPAAVKGALAALQPAAMPGLRLINVDQMHLTLHFIGEAVLDRVATVLGRLSEPMISFSLYGVGHFQSADGAVTLWAGVQQSTELRKLHANVAAALSGERFRPENRAYTPHITLARCDPTIAPDVIDNFLAHRTNFSMPAILIAGFSLYSSEFVGGVPVYRRERTFAFRGAD